MVLITLLLSQTKAVRVSSSSLKAGLVFPVAFIARQQHGVLSWQLPFILDYRYVDCPLSIDMVLSDASTMLDDWCEQIIQIRAISGWISK